MAEPRGRDFVPMKMIALALAGLALTACMPQLTHEYDVHGQGEKSVTAGCSQAAEVIG